MFRNCADVEIIGSGGGRGNKQQGFLQAKTNGANRGFRGRGNRQQGFLSAKTNGANGGFRGRDEGFPQQIQINQG